MDTTEIIKQQLEEMGLEVKADVSQIRQLLATNARLLSAAKAANEPDFSGTLKAVSDTIVLALATRAVRRADSADSRIFSLIDGVLIGRLA